MMWNKKHIILAFFLPVQMLLMQLAAENPVFIERYYSNGIYPILSAFFRIILGWIPFSIGDLLVVFGFFVFIRFLVRLIKTRFKSSYAGATPSSLLNVEFLSAEEEDGGGVDTTNTTTNRQMMRVLNVIFLLY